MKENIALEKKQQKDSCQKTATYSFTAHYNEISSKEQPAITTEPQGVRLHFLRFGLFDYNVDHKTSTYHSPDTQEFYNSIFLDQNKKPAIGKVVKEKETTNTTKNDDTQQVTIPLDEVILENTIKLPKLENFYIARTPLRAGYVYMINEKNPKDDFKEFKVDDFGMFEEIEWEKNKENGKYLDIRKATGKKLMYKILQSNEQTYCLAYSPVQWSVKYVNEILTNTEKRAEQCTTKFICKGLPKNQQSKDAAVTHYKETSIVVPNSHPMAHKYKDILYSIAADEKQQEKNGGNELLEDLFITLTDPIGCADTICFGVDREIDQLKAIMVSLQTGKSPEEVFPYIRNEQQVPVNQSEESKQIQYLHRLAQLTYDFVYNNHDNTEKYNSDLIKSTTANIALDLTVGGLLRPFIEQNGVEKSKLEKLLGVKERAEQRALINSYRDDLGNVMLSNYYQDAKQNYFNGIADNIEDGKEKTAEHFIALGSYPNMHDRHLDLKIKYQPKKDIWYKHINETLFNENPSVFIKSSTLLNHKIELQDIVNLSFTGKTISSMRKILKAYANHTDFKGGHATLAIHNKISYFRNKNTREVTFKFKALENFDEYLLENKKQLRLELDKKKVSLKKFKKHWHIEYKKMTAKAAQQFIDEGKVVINLKNVPKRFEDEIKKFYHSGALAGVLLIIESVFWAEAFHKWKSENNNSNRTALQGASIKLGAAITRLAEETKTYEKLFNSKTVKRAGAMTKGLGIFSSAISVYSMGNSALTSFSYRDTDAALAYGVATGLSGVFLAADVSSLLLSFNGVGFLSLGFGPAALLGGAIIATIYIINNYLKDTELEAYFKNFPLSDYTLSPKSRELPYEYIHRLILNIEKSISGSNKYQGFKDLETAFVELTDILTPNYIETEILLPQDQLKAVANRTYHSSLHYVENYQVFSHRFNVHLYTAYPCNSMDDLDIKAWFYPNGIHPNAKKTEITTFIYDFHEHDGYGRTKNPSCSINFAIPENAWYYNEPFQFGYEFLHAEVLFLIRVIKDEDTKEYSPSSIDNKDRYTHVYFSIKQTYLGIMIKPSTVNFFKTHTRYEAPVNIKELKPKRLTHEQAMHKRNVFEINLLNTIESYTSKNE